MIIKQFDLLLRENASYEYGRSNRKKFSDADIVFKFCNSEALCLGDRPEEHVYVFALNTKCELIGMMQTGIGGASYAPVSIREIITFALQCSACGLILVHNHPSGDTQPSSDDYASASKLSDACELLNLKLLDSIIVGRYDYTSLKALGAL